MSNESKSEQDFLCLELLVEAGDENEGARQEVLDRVIAECWGAGAAGIEERDADRGILLLVYVQRRALEEVLTAGQSAGGTTMRAPELVGKRDWSEAWKDGLEAIVVSPQLLVRPSFVGVSLAEGQDELVIDPGQAFGTGGHASTVLILEWLAVLFSSREIDPAFDDRTRVLDVGTGTGVLALAALKLGAGRAVGLDLDPIAATEARHWALQNDLADRFSVLAGPVTALRAEPFDLVLANLLRTELLPIVPELVERVALRGSVVLSGLLAEEQARVESAFAPFGVETLGARFTTDETGDHWISLHMGRS